MSSCPITASPPASVADRRAAWAAAAAGLGGLRDVVWQTPGSELGALLGELDALASLAAGARVAVVAEAEARGEVAASQAGSTRDWVAAHAPSLAVSGAAQVARLVADTRAGAGLAQPLETAPVLDAVVSGAVPVPVGLAVLAEYGRLRPRLQDAAAPTVLAGLLDLAVADGSRGVRSLRPALLAACGLDGELQADHDHAARLVELSRPATDELGCRHYRLTLDPEGAAVLEAAIGPLSAPTPPDDGERDLRSAPQRRGQALLAVCRRATAAPDRPGTGVKTTLLLTMSHTDLAQRTGAATVLGSTAAGTLLAPETVRRLACDAGLLPAILGSRGELLDLGRTSRLATPAQLAALWWRDRGCTFAGCTTPAHWCDAHHLRHWVDGGATDLANLALLCARHHTIVHRDQLAGVLDPDSQRVVWDRAPGSYLRAVDAGPAVGAARAGPAP